MRRTGGIILLFLKAIFGVPSYHVVQFLVPLYIIHAQFKCVNPSVVVFRLCSTLTCSSSVIFAELDLQIPSDTSKHHNLSSRHLSRHLNLSYNHNIVSRHLSHTSSSSYCIVGNHHNLSDRLSFFQRYGILLPFSNPL